MKWLEYKGRLWNMQYIQFVYICKDDTFDQWYMKLSIREEEYDPEIGLYRDRTSAETALAALRKWLNEDKIVYNKKEK